MNRSDYETFYNKVGKINGWDFSNIKSISEGIRWDFYDEVTSRCKNTDVLLDIGTGGGENLLSISHALFFAIGIDLSKGMIEKADSNLRKSDVSNVRFFQMSSENLQFPAGFFDLITSRHAPFSSKEVFKVLKNGGFFLTQQVSESDKLNVKEAFGRGQSFNEEDGALEEQCVYELYESGFSNVQSFEYDAIEYYQQPEDLIFLLKHTPTIPDFGQDKNDFNILSDFIEKNNTKMGIRTNSKRFLLIAEK